MHLFTERIIEFLSRDKWVALFCVVLLTSSQTFTSIKTTEANAIASRTNSNIEVMTSLLNETTQRSIRNQEAVVDVQSRMIDAQERQTDFQRDMWKEIAEITRNLTMRTEDRFSREDANLLYNDLMERIEAVEKDKGV